MRDQGVQDEVDTGPGANVVAGGQFTDVFVFAAGETQSTTVMDMESWGLVDFLDFGYGTAAAARAQMTDDMIVV